MKAVYNSQYGGDIRWERVSGAIGYKVYRQRSAEGTKVAATINNVNTTQCYDTAIKNNCYGRVYDYYVRALYRENGRTVEGPASSRLVLQRVAPMKITSVKPSGTNIDLKWACTVSDNKAQGYQELKVQGDGNELL